jgi:hypothetical protein
MKEEKKPKKEVKTSSRPEKVTGEEALARMKDFSKRKEQIIAAIIESKN